MDAELPQLSADALRCAPGDQHGTVDPGVEAPLLVTGPKLSNHSRRPGPAASGFRTSSVLGLYAASIPACRVCCRLIPWTWVAPPTTTRSAHSTSSWWPAPPGPPGPCEQHQTPRRSLRRSHGYCHSSDSYMITMCMTVSSAASAACAPPSHRATGRRRRRQAPIRYPPAFAMVAGIHTVGGPVLHGLSADPASAVR